MQLRRVLLSALLAGAAWAADPFLGEWKLNVKESVFPRGQAPAAAAMRWEREGDGIRVTTSGSRADGTPYNETYLAVFDGSERPSKGPWNFDAVVNSAKGERERHAAFKRSGKTIGTLGTLVTPDGTRLTERLRFGDEESVRVWDRK